MSERFTSDMGFLFELRPPKTPTSPFKFVILSAAKDLLSP